MVTNIHSPSRITLTDAAVRSHESQEHYPFDVGRILILPHGSINLRSLDTNEASDCRGSVPHRNTFTIDAQSYKLTLKAQFNLINQTILKFPSYSLFQNYPLVVFGRCGFEGLNHTVIHAIRIQ